MDSNSANQNEQLIAMQRRLPQLEQIVAQSSAQPSAEPQTSPNVSMNADEETISALHSLRIRPSYSWSLSLSFSFRSPCTHSYVISTLQFIRSSDLQRIPLSSVSVSDDSIISFEVHSPKEKRKRRHIIKSFQVKAHINRNLCPVHTFRLFLERRPPCQATSMFVNSLQPNKVISTRAIQSWISKLIQRSTDEKRVSLRSIAFSLALQSGIPKDDIVAMGNWSSSTTFENHYHREHLSTFDFTNLLITCDDISDDDVLYDAIDNHIDIT